MLPSTGFFKGITCPFFESGLCERPYCHFRHVKRDIDINSDTVENADILKQLVSEAVKKVLLQTESISSDLETKSESIISQVVQELKPASTIVNDKPSLKATYNPTPIAELNKMSPAVHVKETKPISRDDNRKHIPVPYTPHRPSRTQLSRAPVKLDSGSALSLNIRETCTAQSVKTNLDKYTPSAIESESSVKYLPGSAADNPMPYSPIGQTNVGTGGISYIPSNLSCGMDITKVCGYSPVGQSTSGVSYRPGAAQASSSNSYCPTNNSTLNQADNKPFSYAPKFNYKPTPLAKVPTPAFSSDEDDEPSPKKPKLSDSEELDDLDVEFEMLGEILEDENNSVKKPIDTTASIVSKSVDNAEKSIKQNDSENKLIQNSFDTLFNDNNNSSKADKKTSEKHTERSSSKKEHTKSSSNLISKSDDKIVPSSSKHSKSSRESKSSKSDHRHSTKKKEENSSKERDKDSVSKNRDSSSKSMDLSKKSSNESNRKSSHDHKKIDKHKKNSKDEDTKVIDTSHKNDRDGKSKSLSSSKQSDYKSYRRSSEKVHSKSSNSKHESKMEKSTASSKERHRDKSLKSSHFTSRHSSKDKTLSKESSSHKSKSSHSKHKPDTKKACSKGKYVKDVDLFSVSNADGSDKMSDIGSNNSDIVEIFSDSDEETITQECMKIFEEYVPAAKDNTPNANVSKPTNDEMENQTSGKKRVAHNTNITIYRTPSTALPNHKSRAVQMVTDRYVKVKQFHSERSSSASVSTEYSSPVTEEPSVSNVASSSKVRIAHVPYASTLYNAKKALQVPEPPKSTPVQTITKGSNRVAHMPNENFSDRPTPLEPLASKVPINIRSSYLNKMIDDCLKIYLTAEDAYERALQEELNTNKRCTTIPIYKNSALLTISRLRKEIKEAGGKKISNGNKCISHNKVMLGKKGETTSWSIENKYRKDNTDIANELKGRKFYDNIHKWILTEQELRDNGFPRPHPDKKEKGCAKIYTQNTRQKPPKGFTRCCNRCKKEYNVDKKGFAVRKEECIYHPNNKYRFRGEVKYQCCGQDASSDGCQSASCHVFEYVDHDNLRGYVTTLPKDKEPSEHGIYALDCEMSYTTNGLDLTRVTVINSNLKVVYETLVKPLFPIIDYNTNFSGITEEQMKGVTTSLLEVQATLLHMFSDKTILVGHSLESDFKALKLIHNTVVDTSVLFPHKMGPPYKRALRNLSSEYLKKIIQNSLDGHDSAEDALVCMELLMWKVKEEFKTK